MHKTTAVLGRITESLNDFNGSDFKFVADCYKIEHPKDTLGVAVGLIFKIRENYLALIEPVYDASDPQWDEAQDAINKLENEDLYWWLDWDNGSLTKPLFDKVSRWMVKDGELSQKKKICISIYQIMAILYKWSNKLKGSSDEFLLTALWDNLLEKLNLWYYEETEDPIFRSYPWVTNLSEKELGEGLPPLVKLSKDFKDYEREKVLSNLDRINYLKFIPIDELAKAFGYNDVTAPKPMGHADLRLKIIRTIGLGPTNLNNLGKKFGASRTTIKKYLNDLIVNGIIESTNVDEPVNGTFRLTEQLWTKPSISKSGSVSLPKSLSKPPSVTGHALPGPTVGPPSSSGGFQILDATKGKSTAKAKPSGHKSKKELIKRVEKALMAISKKDGKGVHRTHIYLFVGNCKEETVQSSDTRIAEDEDIREGRCSAAMKGKPFRPMIKVQVARNTEAFLKMLKTETDYKGTPQSTDPAFQKLVHIYPAKFREKRKKTDKHHVFNRSKSLDGWDAEPIAKWLCKFMPVTTKQRLPIIEEEYGLKSS